MACGRYRKATRGAFWNKVKAFGKKAWNGIKTVGGKIVNAFKDGTVQRVADKAFDIANKAGLNTGGYQDKVNNIINRGPSIAEVL